MIEPTTKQTGEPFGLAADFPPVDNDLQAVGDNAPRPEDAHSQRSEFLSMAREIVETIVLSLIIFLVIRQGIQNYRIESHSMEPNFYDGQYVLVNKLAYKLGEPQRGDVVVFHNPNNPDEDYIKRIIGLPGDTISFDSGVAYVNGKPLDEPYVNFPTNGNSGAEPLVVDDGYIFVMGDNRPNSRDSRVFGELSEDLMVGKAWVRIWPLTEMGRVGHIELVPGEPTAWEE
jgi:signal peptidase I